MLDEILGEGEYGCVTGGRLLDEGDVTQYTDVSIKMCKGKKCWSNLISSMSLEDGGAFSLGDISFISIIQYSFGALNCLCE